MEKSLPAIPAKRYFTIGEVSELCGVKPYVLRYWEQEFSQLRPMKRRGNRRYYQHHEVLLVRRIRELLYEHGFTISGARNRLADGAPQRGLVVELEDVVDLEQEPELPALPPAALASHRSARSAGERAVAAAAGPGNFAASKAVVEPRALLGTEAPWGPEQVRQELLAIRHLLEP